MKKKVIIVGGGAAGLMAAGRAAEAGAQVIVLEKMRQPGRKICISGKGRCNITNIAEVREFIGHFGKTGNFLRQAFARFFSDDLLRFFEANGLKVVKERGGRVFPASGKAADVVAVLLKWVEKCGVEIRRSATVEKLLISDGRIVGVVAGGKEIHCDALIIATGGASYRKTGSTGDGYRLAEAAGHRVVPIRAALVPLETAGNLAAKMAELNLRNIKVNMYADGKKRREEFGELVFAKFGVTGPVILTLSGEVVDRLSKGEKISLSIDLKPALDEKKLDARLLRDFESRRDEPLSSLLRGLLPREMVPVCLELTGLSPERTAIDISAKERRRLLNFLKDFRFEVTRPRPLDEAIVTAGGVDTRELDPKTMESKIIKGLYLTGELLDIQADTGGYNLQAAFSTGWLAGGAAASGE
ncbi:MAG: NAD(P)/FAD-dependent oxidoreductase [Proteobacteria bacterium]|nr:NAD(P)/FAD-dependent oxidoreductase [Pseudomonadota bacterium]